MFRSLFVAALLSLLTGTAGAQQLPTIPSRAEATAAADQPSQHVAVAERAHSANRPALKIGGGGVRVGEPSDAAPESRGTSAWGVMGALALVLGLFAAAVKWFGGSRLSAGAVGGGSCEVLARIKLEPRASMHVVRIGGRVILVGSAADGLTALGEIDDPVEAEALAASCRVSQPSMLQSVGGGGNAARESFRTLFGRAAERAATSSEPSATERDEPLGTELTSAERRLAARLRPAGATR